MANPNPPERQSPQLNDRCGCYGEWLDDEMWVTGRIVAVGGMSATIKTDTGQELQVANRRMTWKKSKGEWAVWSPQVDAEVQTHVHVRTGDGRSKYNRRLVPGEYVRCQIGSRFVGGFVCKALIEGYRITVPTEKTLIPDAGVNSIIISSDMLSFDDERGCWQARHRKVKPT